MKTECVICGKRGFLMDSKDNIYCKSHRYLEIKPHVTMDCESK